MKYLKEFENHNAYTAYTADTENFILPNVSYCVQENEVHMSPYVEPQQPLQFIARYNVTEFTEYGAPLLNINNKSELIEDVESITLDNVELDISQAPSIIQADELGEHTLIITLKEGITEVCSFDFSYCDTLTSVTIPNGISRICVAAFEYTSLTSITIPSSVTSIDDVAFISNNLVSVTCLPTTPPILGEQVFNGLADNCKFYVPSASVNAYRTAEEWSIYAYSHTFEPIPNS